MISRIRDVRIQQGLTLADVAARCHPPTTAQTIGRLETGTRNLSLVWMNRIAAALGVEPEQLLRSETTPAARLIATLTAAGPEALRTERDAILPPALTGEAPMLVIAVEGGCGEYRTGDQIWLREAIPPDYPRHLNRDVLAPRPGGRFAFGRLIDHDHGRIALLPPGSGQRQIVVDSPPWIAVAELLIRTL